MSSIMCLWNVCVYVHSRKCSSQKEWANKEKKEVIDMSYKYKETYSF